MGPLPTHPSSSTSLSYPTEIKITSSNCTWVFIAGSADPRHIDDVVWGIHVLESRGVPQSKMIVYSDHPTLGVFLKEFPNVLLRSLGEIFQSYPNDVKTNHVVVVGTGHGTSLGIPVQGSETIAPAPLVNLLKSAASLETVTLVLTQCYAGIFNYLNIRGQPWLTVIGSTNLHLSISSRVEFIYPKKTNDGVRRVSLSWDANIFMLRFFQWFDKPIDIDGDGKLSLLDCYRFAGSVSNDQMRAGRDQLRKILEMTKKALADLDASKDLDGSRRRALEKDLADINASPLHSNIQEAWILHPDLARCLIVNDGNQLL